MNGSAAVTLRKHRIRSFHSAGKVQASNEPQDMPPQPMLRHPSALAVPEPKSVLVVACGAHWKRLAITPLPISWPPRPDERPIWGTG